MKRALVLLAACSPGYPPGFHSDSDAPPSPTADAAAQAGLPPPIAPGDFTHALDQAYIRAPQTWLGDAAFATKWQTMMTAPIEFLGGASSAYHLDLASRADKLPGGEVICHGDAKLDNFGWTRAAGGDTFNDNDFDDGGDCPAAADILHFLIGVDLELSDPSLDELALSTYVAVINNDAAAIAIDPSELPVWDDVRSKGVDKATSHGSITLGGEVQAATSDEIDAVTALVESDARFPTDILDITRDVHTDGGSAGMRRFWVLAEDAEHPRTIIELKEVGKPGTEFGPHTHTYDGPTRFDTLETAWWGAPATTDHFSVNLLGAMFLERDRFARETPNPAKLTPAQIQNAIGAEVSLMARRHRAAWAGVDPGALQTWLGTSASALATRWRTAYTADGGM